VCVYCVVRSEYVIKVISIFYNGYRVIPRRVKRPKRGVNHPLPYSAAVKKKVELYFYPPSVSLWQVIGLHSTPVFKGLMRFNCTDLRECQNNERRAKNLKFTPYSKPILHQG
jgi:hypothetical protein